MFYYNCCWKIYYAAAVAMAERNIDSEDGEFIATWCIQLRIYVHILLYFIPLLQNSSWSWISTNSMSPPLVSTSRLSIVCVPQYIPHFSQHATFVVLKGGAHINRAKKKTKKCFLTVYVYLSVISVVLYFLGTGVSPPPHHPPPAPTESGVPHPLPPNRSN